MIKLIAPYKLDGVEQGTWNDLIEFLNNTKYFGIDSETSGNFDWGPHGMKLVMLQISDERNQFVIDARYYDIKKLEKYFRSKKWLKIGHNIKFDAQVLKKEGIIMNNVFDTMVVSNLLTKGLTEEYKRGKWRDLSHSLVACCRRYLDIDIDSNQLNLFMPEVNKSVRTSFKNILYEDFNLSQVIYGGQDAEMPVRLYHTMLPKIKEQGLSKVVNEENKYSLVLADTEYAGIPCNSTKFMNLIAIAGDKAVELEEQLNEEIAEFSDPINWNSNPQVSKVFKHLGIPVTILDKKALEQGDVIYKDSVASIHMKQYSEKFPIVDMYLKYKEYRKLHTSYGLNFLSKINPITNRIHSNFMQLLNTGRIASTNPNLQQIPRDKEYRECIEAPEGRTFVIADYSS